MMRLGQRGVSLMEAVVALAVMGFGMLGVAAMQSSLRQNADLARQRAEAVRLAQDAIERNRSYSVIATTATKQAYDDIPVADSNNTFSGTNRNASYTRAVESAASAPFNLTSVKATVTWTDRANNTQSVLLASQIHRVPPELAGSLIVDGSRTVPQLRSGSSQVPPGWLDRGDGSFSPPITGGLSPNRYFFGSDGIIRHKSGACTTATSTTCSFWRLVQGYVSFATSGTPSADQVAAGWPTSSQAENPTDTALPAALTATAASTLFFFDENAPSVSPVCYYELLPTPVVRAIGYNCLISVASDTLEGSKWSHRISLAFTGLAADNDVNSASAYRVCRYTRYLNDQEVGSLEMETGQNLTNADHPRRYKNVAETLYNQNYLVIKAGNGAAKFKCPDDDAATPVYGRTWQHQPANP